MLNVLCALALAFRGVSESRGGARMDSEPLRKASTALVESVLETGTTPLVRAVAAEALGRLSQAVGDPQVGFFFREVRLFKEIPLIHFSFL